MSPTETGLRLRLYQGRESGLMIIGTAEELGRLGEQLIGARAVLPDGAIEHWPPLVAEPPSSGPFADRAAFRRSFHRQVGAELPASLRLVRRGVPRAVSVVVVIFALIGVAATVQWLA